MYYSSAYRRLCCGTTSHDVAHLTHHRNDSLTNRIRFNKPLHTFPAERRSAHSVAGVRDCRRKSAHLLQLTPDRSLSNTLQLDSIYLVVNVFCYAAVCMDQGLDYYYNTETKETTWDKPEVSQLAFRTPNRSQSIWHTSLLICLKPNIHAGTDGCG